MEACYVKEIKQKIKNKKTQIKVSRHEYVCAYIGLRTQASCVRTHSLSLHTHIRSMHT